MGGSNKPKLTGAKPGTWGHLCAEYMSKCADFKRLDTRTRHVRKLTLDAMSQEPIKPGSDRTFNDFPLSKMSAHDIEVLRDRKIHTPEARSPKGRSPSVQVWREESKIPKDQYRARR